MTATTTLLRNRARTASHAMAGARDVLPLLAGVAPFGVVIGITLHAAQVDHLAGWAGSFLICAGSAQLAVIQLLDQGAAPIAVIGTVAMINSRFALYSAGMSRWFGAEPLHRRLLLALPVVDQLFVLCSARFGDPGGAGHRAADVDARREYFAGAAVVLVLGWVTVQSLAFTFAPMIGDVGFLTLAAPLTFVGMLVNQLKDRGTVVAAGAAALTMVAAAGAPRHTNLLIAIAAGIALGSLGERSTR